MPTTIATTPAGFTDCVLAIHGGAGTLLREKITAEIAGIYHEALRAALRAGQEVLRGGHSALDAVCAAVACLEDEPLFNAGRGAVFTHEGRNELDAAVMDGATGRAGAIAGVHIVRNPVRLARAVLEDSPFVLLIGEGAEEFGRRQGIEMVDPSYFATPERWNQLQAVLRHEAETSRDDGTHAASSEDNDKFGTVGAVARDQAGNLAAATSTGGMTGKRFGRVGDSPIIGAGTWAANTTCAVSATGHGEYFIRAAVAHDIHARIAYGGASLVEAAHTVIHGPLKEIGGSGGVIAIDAAGNVALPLNTSGMYRGILRADGTMAVAIFAEDSEL